MTEFISAGSGNWNNPAAWTGGDGTNYPSKFTDTVTIASNHQLVIPYGSVASGRITLDPGLGSPTVNADFTTPFMMSGCYPTSVDLSKGRLTIAGRLNLGGNLNVGFSGRLIGGADGVLDLYGHNVVTTKYVWNQFVNTAGARFVIQSTGAPQAVARQPQFPFAKVPLRVVTDAAGNVFDEANPLFVRILLATPNNAQGIVAELFANPNGFYGNSVLGLYSITGSLFTNSQTIYGATVTASYTVTGALYSNAQVFYGASVSTSYTITGALVSNSQTFYTATVTPGPVTITGALFTNSQTFYACSIADGLYQFVPTYLVGVAQY